jgi:hypothetical protein
LASCRKSAKPLDPGSARFLEKCKILAKNTKEDYSMQKILRAECKKPFYASIDKDVMENYLFIFTFCRCISSPGINIKALNTNILGTSSKI